MMCMHVCGRLHMHVYPAGGLHAERNYVTSHVRTARGSKYVTHATSYVICQGMRANQYISYVWAAKDRM
jgi:hypothetical protein